MTTIKEHELIAKLTQLINDNDYSQLSRELLDLSHEMNFNHSLEETILTLRRAYLNGEEKAILQHYSQTVIAELSKQTIQLKETVHSILPVCKAIHVSKQFTGSVNAFKLNEISLELHYGQITGIVGENGNGKTTLLRILAGELSSDTGSVTYPALHCENDNWYAAKEKFVFIPQRIPKWYGSLIDNLHFFASIHGITGAENLKQINYILLRLGLEKYKDLTWSQLSSGYRLRFELAKAIMWRPKLLLLDEPLANLDINAQQLFLKDLKLFSKSTTFPLSIVMSSQQLHEVESISDNIIFIKQGQTIYNGSQQQFAVDRLYNTFELSGDFTKEQLASTFKNQAITIENFGSTFIVSVDKSLTCELFLQELINNKIPITYFRDISSSTRKLFHRDI